MSREVDLLIIGTGPFGLGMARFASAHHIDYVAVGKPMSFWREHMPAGMLLRSGVDWHLDPLGELTMERCFAENAVPESEITPLSLHAYIGYCDWFRRQISLRLVDDRVTALDVGSDGRLVADLGDGTRIVARTVLTALGFQYFRNVPEELTAILPEGSFVHTRDCVNPHALSGRRCLIVGGRQSAFEWAALLAGAGAAAVHVVHRHPSPEFRRSDWRFVETMLARTEAEPGWYRKLPTHERDAVDRRFWQEGRLKLEPWLAERIDRPRVRVWPQSRLVGCTSTAPDALRVELADADDERHHLEIDRVVLATGYKIDFNRVPFLAPPLRERLRTSDGFPLLDERFETSVPGLFVTSMPATRDFGPFLAFTVSVRVTSRIIGAAIAARLRVAPA